MVRQGALAVIIINCLFPILAYAQEGSPPNPVEGIGGIPGRDLLIGAVLVIMMLGLLLTAGILVMSLRKQPVHARLVFLKCADPDPTRQYNGPKEFLLREKTNVIGRDKSRGARIVLDYKPVSRVHAEITRKVAGVYTLQDLDSTSGTFKADAVTGRTQKLDKYKPVRLNDGEIVYFTEYLSFLFRVQTEGRGDSSETEMVQSVDEDTGKIIKFKPK